MNNTLTLTTLFALLFTVIPSSYGNKQNTHDYTVDTIASGLGVPWGMAVMPNNTLLVSQRAVLLSQINLDTGKVTAISGLPKDIKVVGQ